jgi:protein phosphatase
MRPLAITSDIHSCFPEFVALLEGLGFKALKSGIVAPADDRLLLFAGDLVDRGEDAALVLLLMDRLVKEGYAKIAALGNHDERLADSLAGRGFGDKIITSAVDTLRQLLIFPDPTLPRQAALDLFEGAPRMTVLPEERIVVTHGAAFPGDLHPKAKRDGSYLTRGVLASKPDGRGRRPRTYNWVKEWRRHHYRVVFGHHPTANALPGLMAGGSVIAIDTGCVMGGHLSAFLYPEQSFLLVKGATRVESYPRGIQSPMSNPGPSLIRKARVTAARTARWTELVLSQHGLTL